LGGKSEQDATEIAGRTENKTTLGTGNPSTRLEERAYAEFTT
jgi:hypothetical protein